LISFNHSPRKPIRVEPWPVARPFSQREGRRCTASCCASWWNKFMGNSLDYYPSSWRIEMRRALVLSALLLSVPVTPASAKGCLKGAFVGGVAGHYAGHHGAIGAAAGCLIGRHQAKKRARVEQRLRQSDPGRI